MYGANPHCDGQCSWVRGREFAIPACPAEIEWWFPDCAQLVADEGCNDVPPSDKLHNVLLANKTDAIPDENNITVQGILEKSWPADAAEHWRLPTRSANHPDIVLRCGHIKGSQENRNHKALSHTGIFVSSRFWSA